MAPTRVLTSQDAAIQAVRFRGKIDEPNVTELVQTLKALPSDADIHLSISTPGGSVNDGFVLYQNLLTMEHRLTTYNPDRVQSIGNAPFLAGGTRIAAPGATFFFHEIHMLIEQGTYTVAAVKRLLDRVELERAEYVELLVDRTDIPPREAKELLEGPGGYTVGVDWALERGVIHRVGTFPPEEVIRLSTSGAAGSGGP